MKLGILGCGNMGKAFLASLIQNKIFDPEEIIVCNRTEAKNFSLQQSFGIKTTLNPQDLENIETVILGIKPQGLTELNFCPKKEILIISLLVGTTIDTLQKKFASAKIVRFMPNIGQYFGFGVTGIYTQVTQKNDLLYKKIDRIASSDAQAIWLDKESDINNIAAISGSGPAYFFAFADALQAAAQNLGFDKKTSINLALQTFLGAAEFVKQKNSEGSISGDSLFGKSIATVASKGGTTQAALKIFSEQNLDNLIQNGVDSAVIRGEELAKQ